MKGLSIRLSRAERESLIRQTKERGISISDFIREKIWREWAELVVSKASWQSLKKYGMLFDLL